MDFKDQAKPSVLNHRLHATDSNSPESEGSQARLAPQRLQMQTGPRHTLFSKLTIRPSRPQDQASLL